MSQQWAQKHLSEAVELFGSGGASAEIVALIEEGMAEQNRASQDERMLRKGTSDKENPYVTDIGKCPRAVVKSLLNHPVTNGLTTDSLINFGVGHAVEEWLCSTLEDAGAVTIREVSIKLPTPSGGVVSGRIDLLSLFPELGMMVEIKSTSSRSMYWMLKKGELGKPEHRSQINQYMHGSQQGALDGVLTLPEGKSVSFDKGFVVYVVKDATKGEPNVHAWEVMYDPQAAVNELQVMDNMVGMAAAGTVPEIPEGYKPTKFPCSYCSFKEDCWSGN